MVRVRILLRARVVGHKIKEGPTIREKLVEIVDGLELAESGEELVTLGLVIPRLLVELIHEAPE